MNEAIERSLTAGCIGGCIFFVLSAASLFMVSGDGTAAAFTHVMLKLNELPFHIVNSKVNQAMLFIAAAFWAIVIASLTFVVTLGLRKK